MRNVIIFIIFLIFSFLINVVFYYVSSEYRNFLSNIKAEKILTMEETKNNEDNSSSGELTDIDENNDDLTIVKPNNKNDELFNESQGNKIEIKEEVKLGKSYRDILRLFSSYNLQELEINTSLFDITNEYPDNYIEYYSKGLTLYFFPTKTYTEVYDIFKVLEFDLPFVVNPVNNFWDNSFYINLNSDIDDNIVRLVITNKGVVFWLKINKNEYNLVKEKLNTLRPNN